MTLALIFSALVAATPSLSTDQATQLYSSAVATTAALSEPPYIAYRLEGESDENIEVRLVNEGGQVWLRTAEGTARTTWYVLHRTRDSMNTIIDQNKERYLTSRSFFDPTWYGAYHALHDGMFFPYEPKRVLKTPSPLATPLIGPTSVPGAQELRVIALVSAMGPAIYIVHDGGSVSCENGDPGRALVLTARTSPEMHQLTNAIVDLKSTRFCMLRFSERHYIVDRIATGISVEQRYGSVGAYWLQTDGEIYYDMPVLPFGTARSTWQYKLLGTTFLPSIPDYLFVETAPR